MDDKEKVQSFADMVNATEKLTKPWKILCIVLALVIVLSNAIWGFVHWKQLQYAYMTPVEFGQEQQFDQHSQNQQYSSGATDGN